MLPTVHEACPLNPTAAVAASQRASTHQQSQQLVAPWQSPAIAELTQSVGQSPNATPMMIEGRTGTVLAAIGEQRDHDVAGRALNKALVQPRLVEKAGALGGPAARGGGCGGGGGAVASAGGGKLAAAAGNNRQRHGASFAAVYEYRDSVGKPRYVGGTSEQPEAAYADDFEANAGVRSMFEGVREAAGRATVVWAGVGGGPCGDLEMKAARDAVCKDRAQRQNLKELAGAKPYSRHSHLLAQ